jgi:hypothetical protein
MTAYRNDVDALAAREEVLTREVADKQRERDEVVRMLEEARTVEAAEAIANDVMVGRRRVRRLAIGLAVLAVLIGAGIAAAAALLVIRDDKSPAVAAPVVSQAAPARDDVRFGLALATKGLEQVSLEPRFVPASGFDTLAELDEAIGEAVPPWQQFSYTRDAQVRQAVASPAYRVGAAEPEPEFVTDSNGGVWRVTPAAETVAATTGRWTRKVWLLPLGSSFRGDVEIAFAR